MDDVAAAAGVSKGAVSHVLNNRPGEIGPETRDRVLRAMRELGYRPPPSKRAVVRGRYDTLGIVVGCRAAELTRPSYYNAVFESILIQTEARKLNVTLYTGDIFEIDTLDKVRLYCDGRCDGMLLIGTRAHSPLPEIFAERGVSCVVIGDSTERTRTSSVDVDNAHGIRVLIDYLYSLGHRRYGFVVGPDFVATAGLRRAAFDEIIGEAGLKGYALDYVNGPHDQVVGSWIATTMALPKNERPTAFIGWNDQAGRFAVQMLASLGFQTPDDVSVVGFDDAWYVPEEYHPRLTTYRQPYAEIGRRAVERCLDRYERPSSESHVDLISGKLIVRQSTGPAKE